MPDRRAGFVPCLLAHAGPDPLSDSASPPALAAARAVDDETEAGPLVLAAALQSAWLQPARWRTRRWLAALHATLHRDGPRRRLQARARALSTDPANPEGPTAVPATVALQLLGRLDHADALADAGEDPMPPLAGLLHKQRLAGPALAAVQRASARVALAKGQRELHLLALTQARRHRATPSLRAELSRALPPDMAPSGPDWRVELGAWQRLLEGRDDVLRRIAARQLATLFTDGQLEPHPPVRCAHDAPTVARLWQGLAAHPLHLAAATAALAQPALVQSLAGWQAAEGDAVLWFENPGARQVLVVFSCVATHHTFAEVTALHGRFPGRHLMFVRCPALDWYCDDSFDRVRAQLRARIADRFAPEAVSCWYGSMGGHGALKFALEFGWRAIVFNPQTDLDLWAAFRPRERSRLWSAARHARLDEWPLQAWERAPMYVACGAATPDRAALSVLIAQWRRCRRLDLIVEKFDDANHAGLMNRIAGDRPTAVLQRIDARLCALATAPSVTGAALDETAQADFWDRLDAAASLKLEVQLREGRLHWRPSLATGTLASR